MNILLYIKHIFIFGILLLTGCVKHSKCNADYDMIVKSADINGSDITGTGVVNDVLLYIFDSNGNFIEMINTYENIIIPLNYPSEDKITVVAWGNTANGSQKMPDGKQETGINDSYVELNTKTLGTMNQAQAPDDIFFGKKEILFNNPSENTYLNEIIVKRKVSSVTIILHNLKQWYGSADSDYSVRISETFDAIDFNGTLVGEKVWYEPQSAFNSAGDLVVPTFRTLASNGNPIIIDIYKGSDKIYSISTDKDANPLILEEGKLLAVDVDFLGENGQMTVIVKQNDWEKIDIEQDF